jgi:voltage-gated potassium channel
VSDESQATAPQHGLREDLKSTTYELFILAVSILSIVNLVLASIFEFRSPYWWLVAMVDIFLTVIFVIDFIYRLRTTPSKGAYMKHGGVLDLLGCLPGLRFFRLFRIWRAVRVIRRLGGKQVFHELRTELASGTLFLIIVLGLTTLEFVGLLELFFEQDAPGGNIDTGGDALWWGYVTATTVGYGDQYPVTTGGRIMGLLMLTVGVALFATFSGFVANAFLSRTAAAKSEPPSEAAAGSVEAALRELELLLAQQQQATEALRTRLADIETASRGSEPAR